MSQTLTHIKEAFGILSHLQAYRPVLDKGYFGRLDRDYVTLSLFILLTWSDLDSILKRFILSESNLALLKKWLKNHLNDYTSNQFVLYTSQCRDLQHIIMNNLKTLSENCNSSNFKYTNFNIKLHTQLYQQMCFKVQKNLITNRSDL